MSGDSTVPDDYLRPMGSMGETTRSTPPFGYYANAGGKPLYARHNVYEDPWGSQFGYEGQNNTIVIKNGRIVSQGWDHPTGAWLNGMGGMDGDDDYTVRQYGNQLGGVQKPASYGGYSYGPSSGGGGTYQGHRSGSSRPRVIYQQQPYTRYWGNAGRNASIIPGASNNGGYTMSGRSAY